MRDFVFDTSGVVLGSAMAIRGLVEGDPFLATIGLSVLAVFVGVEVAAMRARKRPPGERRPRVGRAWLARVDTPRARRFLAVALALATLLWVVRCIVAAIEHDWGGCLFYGVLASAGTGGAVAERAMSSERTDGKPEAVLPLTIDVP